MTLWSASAGDYANDHEIHFDSSWHPGYLFNFFLHQSVIGQRCIGIILRGIIIFPHVTPRWKYGVSRGNAWMLYWYGSCCLMLPRGASCCHPLMLLWTSTYTSQDDERECEKERVWVFFSVCKKCCDVVSAWRKWKSSQRHVRIFYYYFFICFRTSSKFHLTRSRFVHYLNGSTQAYRFTFQQ